MTAQEMFKEIGLELVWESKVCIVYGDDDGIGIYFSKARKGYILSVPDHYIEEFKEGELLINVDVHKAIHQQMKELGWLVDRDIPIATAALINENGEPLLPRGEVLCGACGERIYETDKFCKHCGQSINRSEEHVNTTD